MKRFLAMFLVVVMVVSAMPVSVWAEGTGNPAPQADHTHKVCTNNQYIHNLYMLIN